MHHHGYTWLGSGYELAKDGPRRPLHPDFKTSQVTPLELAHWLLKPPGFIQGTWTDPHDAATWFEARAGEHAAALLSPHDRDPGFLAARVESATRAVVNGADVTGGWWLTGQRFLSVCLIACSPHRFRPQYPCPQHRGG